MEKPAWSAGSDILEKGFAVVGAQDAQLVEFQVRGLAVHVLEDLIQPDAFGEAQQGEGHPVLPGAARAADAVQVILVFVGQIVIDHRFHVVHVDAPGRHIRADQDGEAAPLEPGHHLIALGLGNIAVEGFGFIAGFVQPLAEPAAHILGVGEDHDPAVDVGIQQVQKMIVFPVPVGGDHVLGDLRPVFLGGGDGDFHWLMLVFPGDGQHVLIGGGGEHHELPGGRDGFDDPAHVLHKAHFQHFVGLVDDQGMHGAEAGRAPVQVIQHAARRGHDDLRPALELVQLLRYGLAAVEHRDAHLRDEGRQLLHFLPDLQGQFPGRGQHHLLDAGIGEGDIFQHGDAESAGFARAGGGDGDHVVALHHDGDGLFLHGRGLGKAHFGHGPEDLVG